MAEIGLTKVRTIGPVAQAVEAAGGSVARVFRRVEVPLSLLDAPDGLMALRDQMRLVEAAVREIGDPALPARLSTAIGIAGLGAIGWQVRTAATLRTAIMRMEHVTPALLQTATWTGLQVDGARARYGYAVRMPITEGRRTNEILALGYLLGTMRHFLGPGWRPERALVAGATLPARAEIEALFGCEIGLGVGAGLVFPAVLLETRNPDPGHPPDWAEPSPDLPAPDDLVATVGHLIGPQLGEGPASIDWVCRRLGLSRRSLQRRLDASGTGFRPLLRGLMQARASRLLATTTRPIGEIALDLGYADPSHFSRAFLDWTGFTPRQYRALGGSENA